MSRDLCQALVSALALAGVLWRRGHAPSDPDRPESPDRGQTTAEYALVLLGAATVALLLVAWATGSGKIDQLFNAVFDHLIAKAR